MEIVLYTFQPSAENICFILSLRGGALYSGLSSVNAHPQVLAHTTHTHTLSLASRAVAHKQG